MTYFGPTQVVTKRLTEEKLTPREREVALMAHKSNKEIAEALHLSLCTVKVHLGRVYSKIGLNSTSTSRSALVLMVERGQVK